MPFHSCGGVLRGVREVRSKKVEHFCSFLLISLLQSPPFLPLMVSLSNHRTPLTSGIRPAERLCRRPTGFRRRPPVVPLAPPLWTRRADVDHAGPAVQSEPLCAIVGHSTPTTHPYAGEASDAARRGDAPSPTSVRAPPATAIGARVTTSFIPHEAPYRSGLLDGLPAFWHRVCIDFVA